MTARLRPSQVEWVADRLTARDWQIIEAVNRLRLLTGAQIERLFFAGVASGRSRIASRSRVLHRLVAWRVLVPLPRRIGGAGRGSTTLAFALDSAGVRLVRERQIAAGYLPRVRRPGSPGERTVRHILAVSESCVTLTDLARVHGSHLPSSSPNRPAGGPTALVESSSPTPTPCWPPATFVTTGGSSWISVRNRCPLLRNSC